MFMFDIETLGIESTTVVLSAGIIYFDPEVDTDLSYLDFVKRGLMVKFDSKDQITRLNRTITKSTIDWWNKQGEYQRKSSMDFDKDHDLAAEDGIKELRKYINYHNKDGDKMIIWARGSLDQMAIDSLALAAGTEPIADFNKWRDVRTAVDLMTGSTNGYCEVDGITKDEVIKHHPVHDCAYDILMLLRGKDQTVA